MQAKVSHFEFTPLILYMGVSNGLSMVSFKTYQPDFIKDQVDLIWSVTDQWKYGYQTSYNTVEKAYAREGFDPKSRIYAFDDGEMIGFVGANISENEEGQKVASMRFPLAKDDDMEIIQQLMKRMESYLVEKGIFSIRAPAGVGLGNTIEAAELLGFNRGQETFRRTYGKVSELNISGNTDGVDLYTDDDEEAIRNLFKYKMGMPEQQGEGFFNWALSNTKRKNSAKPHSASWQIYRENDEIKGFSYLMKSDHTPTIGHSMPFYFDGDGKIIIDRLISAHLVEISNIELFGNYLMPYLYHLEELYNSFGFEFDPSYMYSKQLSS